MGLEEAFKIQLIGPKEMTQSVKVFASHVQGPNFNAQKPCKKLSVAVCSCNPRIRETETGGFLRLSD